MTIRNESERGDRLYFDALRAGTAKITLSKNANNQLLDISQHSPSIYLQIMEKLSYLQQRRVDNIDIKKLRSKNRRFFRIKSGKYRIIIEFVRSHNPDIFNVEVYEVKLRNNIERFYKRIEEF